MQHPAIKTNFANLGIDVDQEIAKNSAMKQTKGVSQSAGAATGKADQAKATAAKESAETAKKDQDKAAEKKKGVSLEKEVVAEE